MKYLTDFRKTVETGVDPRRLYNTDNGHEISAPERKFIQTEPLYYGHSNDDSSYSTRFPVCRYISESECNQLSHCSYDDSIMFSLLCLHTKLLQTKVFFQSVKS